MKKIILIASLLISSIIMVGCKSTESNFSTYSKIQEEKKSKAFNDEVYIWESLNFTDRKVEDK